MKKEEETRVLSELSFVSIKNYSDTIMLTLLPHMGDLLNVAKGYAPPTTIARAALGRASEIKETSSTIRFTQSMSSGKDSFPTLAIKEQPLEIVLKQTPDEKTLQSLMRLVGEYSPTLLSSEESEFLMEFLEQHGLSHTLKYQRSGIKIVIDIPEQTFRPLYHLPPVFDLFTGRERELRGLKESCSRFSESSQITQVSGTGGIGKTQLVNFFARQQFENGNYQWVVWLSGGLDEETATNKLRSEFSDLGRALGLEPTQMKRKVLHQLIYERLLARLANRNAQKGRGLIVMDNVSYDIIKKLLPVRYGHNQIDIIFTTRNSRMLGPCIHRIILDVMTLNDAVNYIQKILKSATPKEAATLATTLDRYALAITQALAYISDTGSSIADFCRGYQEFNQHRKSYLSKPVFSQDPYQDSKKDFHSLWMSLFNSIGPRSPEESMKVKENEFDHGLNATMWGVVQLSFEHVKVLCENTEIFNHTCALLKGAAYLAPEVSIPKGLLGGWIPNDPLALHLNKGLEVLRTLSLLQDANKASMVQIHQVVQDVLKFNETEDAKRFRLLQWSKIIVAYLKLPKPISKIEQEERFIALKPHAAILAKQLRQLEESEETLMAALTMYQMAGRAEQYLGEEKAAKASFEEVLRCCDRLPNLTPTLRAKYNMYLATTILTCGDPVEAEKRLKEVLSIFTAESNTSATLRGICLMQLGIAQQTRGNHKNAPNLLVEALDALTKKLNSKHPKVLICSMNLATSLEMCERFSEAEEIYSRILPIMEEVLGPHHVAVGQCILGLGNLYIRDEPDKAIELYLRAHKILEEKLGKQHADVGRSLLNIGSSCIFLSMYSSAKDYIHESLIILNNALGDQHVDVARALICKHEIAIHEEHYTEARDILLYAYKILEKSLGPSHNEVGMCAKQLSVVYGLIGDESSAQFYLNIARDIINDSYTQRRFRYLMSTMCQRYYIPPDMSKSEGVRLMEQGIEALGECQLDVGEDRLLKAIRCLRNLPSQQSNIYKCIISLAKIFRWEGEFSSLLTSLSFCPRYSGQFAVYHLLFENLKNIIGFDHQEAKRDLRELIIEETVKDPRMITLTPKRKPPVRGEIIPKKKYVLHISYIITSLKDAEGLSLIERALFSDDQAALELVKSVILDFYRISYQADLKDAIYFSVINQRIDCLKLFIHFKFPMEEERKVPSWERGPRMMHQTPLQLAVQLESVESIELLVRAGADPNRRTRNCASPIDLAAGNPKLLAALAQQNKPENVLEDLGQNQTLKV